MKLTNKYVGVIFANDGQRLIRVYDFPQLNEKYGKGLFQILRRPGGTTGGVSNPELQCQQCLKQTYK